MENILELNHVSKEFPGFALEDLSLSLPSGCVMGFIGENGAGKSTTIKLILDLLKKDAGEISIFGESTEGSPVQRNEQVGVVMDECNFPAAMSAGSIAKMMAKCYRTWDGARFAQYLGKFELPHDKKIRDYSRGMKMKLMLAAALSHDSRLLLLDEATSGLDPIVRDEILDIFLDFMQDEGHGIFVSSHILSDLEKICDYVAFLHRGKLVFCEEKNALQEKYVVLKCSRQELETLDRSAIVGVRQNSFGAEALALRDRIPAGLVCDPASIEDIMLYHVKEETR